jgi:predicted Fe-Mo cluster-binding NifX family protein
VKDDGYRKGKRYGNATLLPQKNPEATAYILRSFLSLVGGLSLARTQVPQMEEEGGGRLMIFHKEHKVAIASEDGKSIANHLGAAPLFVVYRVNKGKVIEKELRKNRWMHSVSQEDPLAGCWELIKELLPDVKVVISRGMGENAYVGLLRRDVLPINTDEIDTEDAIRAYLEDSLDDNPQLIHAPRRDKDRDHYAEER